jgi:hypothetical protein
VDELMRWRRIAAGSVAFAALAMLAYSLPPMQHAWRERAARAAAAPHPLAATDAEQVAIMRAILLARDWPLRPSSAPYATTDASGATVLVTPGTDVPPRVNGLMNHTLALRQCAPPRPQDHAVSCEMGTREGEDIEDRFRESRYPLAWRRDLVAANLHSTATPDPRIPGLRLVEPGRVAVDQLIGFSRAALSPDRREALVYFGSQGFGAACVVFRLARGPAGWVVSDQEWLCVG